MSRWANGAMGQWGNANRPTGAGSTGAGKCTAQVMPDVRARGHRAQTIAHCLIDPIAIIAPTSPIAPLAHWPIASLAHCLIASLAHCLMASLPNWLIR
jgi:hypothetical protein